MRRSATTGMSARTPPIRRPPSCPPPRSVPRTPARCATQTFDAAQPKATLRYKPTDDLTFYGGWSRGFRSGGFNQTGVGAVAAAEGKLGVHDLFQAEIANTWEVGAKSQFLDRRLSANLALYYTQSHNGYFFFFDTRPPRPRIWAISTPGTRAASSS